MAEKLNEVPGIDVPYNFNIYQYLIQSDMKKSIVSIVFILAFISIFISCGNDTSQEKISTEDTSQKEEKTVEIPRFNRDSAYAYVEEQTEFGPRVPGTQAHEMAKDYIVKKLKSFGVNTVVQTFKAENFKGERLTGYNIIGRINENAEKRILLMSHWDSRFMADHDPVEAMRDQPVPGANDGASGVGILLEIARIMQDNPVDIGVDIVFFDLEDQGKDEGNRPLTWCLGSQYWSKNPHRLSTEFDYGILLDMVGAEYAQFKYEAFSRKYAPEILGKVWNLATAMGYGNYFVKKNIGAITDDHYFVNTIAGIPSIDIIDRRADTKFGFFQQWHTTHDTMKPIDKSTLRAVGQVLIALIYKESIDALDYY